MPTALRDMFTFNTAGADRMAPRLRDSIATTRSNASHHPHPHFTPAPQRDTMPRRFDSPVSF
jgi:hypothetical protein